MRYTLVTLVGIASLVLLMRMSRGEVAVGREIFQGLVTGKPSVQKRIDWAHLSAVGVEVGATYTQLPNEQAKAKYRRFFVEYFSKGFRKAGGSPKAFVRWRIQERTPAWVVVAADYPAKQKTLLLTMATSGRKLQGIQWQ